MLKKFGVLFSGFIPTSKPVLALADAVKIAQASGVDLSKEVCLIGFRGFFNPGSNKRQIYDDAIFILGGNCFVGYNANSDAGAFRKHIANLKEGVWKYQLGIHGLSKPKKLQYQALVQAGSVTVHRDQEGDDSGYFGINIHRGGSNTVSSLGCQTIPPAQWESFISTVRTQLKLHDQKVIKYILKKVENA